MIKLVTDSASQIPPELALRLDGDVEQPISERCRRWRHAKTGLPASREVQHVHPRKKRASVIAGSRGKTHSVLAGNSRALGTHAGT